MNIDLNHLNRSLLSGSKKIKRFFLAPIGQGLDLLLLSLLRQLLNTHLPVSKQFEVRSENYVQPRFFCNLVLL